MELLVRFMSGLTAVVRAEPTEAVGVVSQRIQEGREAAGHNDAALAVRVVLLWDGKALADDLAIGEAGLDVGAEVQAMFIQMPSEQVISELSYVGSKEMQSLTRAFADGSRSDVERVAIEFPMQRQEQWRAAALLLAAGTGPRVECIRICRCPELASSGMRMVAAALRMSPLLQLKSLVISSSSIGDAGATSLAEASSAGCAPQLQMLYLSQNEIGDPGTIALAAAFDTGCASHLKALYLDRNQISDAGACALAGALPRLAALRTFELDNNRVGEGARKAVIGAWGSRGGALRLR